MTRKYAKSFRIPLCVIAFLPGTEVGVDTNREVGEMISNLVSPAFLKS